MSYAPILFPPLRGLAQFEFMGKKFQNNLIRVICVIAGVAFAALAYKFIKRRRIGPSEQYDVSSLEVATDAINKDEKLISDQIRESYLTVNKKQKRKLTIVLFIILCGFLIACDYHYFEGVFFGKGYPYNTFLFDPGNRYSDYFDVIRASIVPDPYATQLTVYFPFAYVLFNFLASVFQPYAGLYILFIASSMVLFFWIYSMLESLKLTTFQRFLSTVIFGGLSYPVLFCWDRGNIEILLLACVLGFLHFFYKDKYWVALVFLLPAICIKLYPAALLAMYLPRRQYLPLISCGLAAIALTFLSLLSFDNPVGQEILEWQSNLAVFKTNYLIGNGAMGSGSSPWNIMKTVFINMNLAKANLLSMPVNSEWAENLVLSLRSLLHGYSIIMLLLALYLTWHIVFVENDLRRQTILLLLFMVVAPAGGADYKMIYLVPVIVLMITLSERKYDFLALFYIAIVLIPKKYFFIPNLITDSGYADASTAVFINPILMILSLIIIIESGWQERNHRALKSV
jgi:predicted nucleic acid-binding Zn ribbon protein